MRVYVRLHAPRLMIDVGTYLCATVCTGRFDYSIPFLRWALQPPEYKAEWHVGVRAEKSGKLVGFITAIPAGMRAWDEKFSAVEINFLCVHKKLRSKRLAPVLIKEVTRRVNVNGIFQAVYTAGAVLPTPVASCRYYHRSLNPKKLIDVGFSRLAPRMTMARTLKLYKLPEEPLLRASGLRKMEPADVPQACALLRAHLSKFALAASFSEAEMSHWFLERPGVVYCYVIQDPLTHNITDMLSFYALPSTIIGNKQYPTLNAAYSFYNVANTVSLTALVRIAGARAALDPPCLCLCVSVFVSACCVSVCTHTYSHAHLYR